MAKAKHSRSDSTKAKAILLTVVLVAFIGWRVFGAGVKLPGSKEQVATVADQSKQSDGSSLLLPASTSTTNVAEGSKTFLDKLLTSYRPRLAAFLSAVDETGAQQSTGIIEFYDGETLVERFKISELKSFGCAVVIKPYGVDIVTSAGTYPAIAWPRPKLAENEQTKPVLISGDLPKQSKAPSQPSETPSFIPVAVN